MFHGVLCNTDICQPVCTDIMSLASEARWYWFFRIWDDLDISFTSESSCLLCAYIVNILFQNGLVVVNISMKERRNTKLIQNVLPCLQFREQQGAMQLVMTSNCCHMINVGHVTPTTTICHLSLMKGRDSIDNFEQNLWPLSYQNVTLS